MSTTDYIAPNSLTAYTIGQFQRARVCSLFALLRGRTAGGNYNPFSPDTTTLGIATPYLRYPDVSSTSQPDNARHDENFILS